MNNAIATAAAATTAALWTFGPPSGITLDPDSLKIVSWSTHEATRRLVELIGTDEAALADAIATVSTFVAARAADDFDRAQGARICRALRRGWLAARIRQHPAARRFANLLRAVASGRATPAQMKLAETLAGEVVA